MSDDLAEFIAINKKIFDGQVTKVGNNGNYQVFSSTLGRNVAATGDYALGLGDRVLLGRDNDNFRILNTKSTTPISSFSVSTQFSYPNYAVEEIYSNQDTPKGFLYPLIFRGKQTVWPVRYYYFEGSTAQVGLVNQIGAVFFQAGVGGLTGTNIINPQQGVTYNCWIEGFLDVKTNMTFPEKWSNSNFWPPGQEPKSRELKKKFESNLATSSTGGFGSNFGILPFERRFEIIDLTIKRQGIALLGEQIIKSLASNICDFMATSEIVDTMVQLPPFILPSFDKTEYGLATPRITEDLFRNNMFDTRKPDVTTDYSDPSILLVPDPTLNNQLVEVFPDPFNSTVIPERSDGFDTDFLRFIRINSAQWDNARTISSLNGTYPIHIGSIYPLWNTRTESVGVNARFQVGVFENGGINFAIGNSAWEYFQFFRDFSLPAPEAPDDGIDRPDVPQDPDDFISVKIERYNVRCYPFYPLYKELVEEFLYSGRTIENATEFFQTLLPDYRIEFAEAHSGRNILSKFFRNPQIQVGGQALTINGYGARQSEIFPFLIFNNNGLTDIDYEGVTFTLPKFRYDPPRILPSGEEEHPPINIKAISTSTPWIKKATVEVLIDDDPENPKYEGITKDIVYDENIIVRGEYEKEPIQFGTLQTTRWKEIRTIDEINLSLEDIEGAPPLEDEGIVRCRFKTTEEELRPLGRKWVKLCTIYRPPVDFAFASGKSIKGLIQNDNYIGLGVPNSSPYIYLYEHDGMDNVIQVRYTIDQVFRSVVCVETFSGLVCRVVDSKMYDTSSMYPTLRLFSLKGSSEMQTHYDELGYRLDVSTDASLLPQNPESPNNPTSVADLSTGFIDVPPEGLIASSNYGTRNVFKLPQPESTDAELRVSPVRENVFLQAGMHRFPFSYDYEFEYVALPEPPPDPPLPVNPDPIEGRINKKYIPHKYYPPIVLNIPGITDIAETPFSIEEDSNIDAIKDTTWMFYDKLNYMLFAPFNFELYKLLGSDRNLVRNKTNYRLDANVWFATSDPATGVIR